MATSQVYGQALQRAADLMGGPEAFARELGVPERAVHSWIAGKAVTPPEAFLRAVDIIIDFDLKAIKGAHWKKEA